jgi:hypothetical protein
MDQETLRRVQGALQGLVGDQRLRVGFLLNQYGQLIAHAGAAPSFHPSGKFAEGRADEEGGENVYMTGIEDKFVVGAVFDEEVAIDTVREVIAPYYQQLCAALTPYLGGAGAGR